MDEIELGPDLHAEADRFFGPCGNADCPTGRLEQLPAGAPRRRHLRLVDPSPTDITTGEHGARD